MLAYMRLSTRIRRADQTLAESEAELRQRLRDDPPAPIAAIAREAGFFQPNLATWLAGRRNFNAESLLRLAEAVEKLSRKARQRG